MAGAYQTPQNERSFSALVDRAVLGTGKTANLLDIIQYANATIRECQASVLSFRDLREETTTADGNPFVWEKPKRLREILAVRYSNQDIYPRFKIPNRQLKDLNNYFYGIDDSFVFKGPLAGEEVQFNNYYWSASFIYYKRLGASDTGVPGGPYDIRPAYFDIVLDEWRFLNGTNDAYIADLGNDDIEDLRERTALNWILEDWWDTVLEGTKAKILKQTNDARAPTTYSLYMQMKKTLQDTAAFPVSLSSNIGDGE